MTTATITAPSVRVAPRGAQLVGLLYDIVRRAVERHRKESSLRQRAKEAEEVRRLARDLASVDPGFAADLYAAADRHVG